jgi:endoglucanase
MNASQPASDLGMAHMKSRWRVWPLAGAVLGTLSSLLGAGEAPFPKGHVFFHSNFEPPEALQGWTGPVRLEEMGPQQQAMAVESSAPADARTAQRKLPAADLRGYTIRATARVKAAQVSAKPNPWNGIKFMLAIETPTGRQWPQAPLEIGTFDWKNAAFTARIPTNATAVTLCLGLEQVTGKVWFDDVKLVVAKPPPPPRPAPVAGPLFKGHPLPRLRGVMISPQIDEAGLRVLGQDWNVNLIRWQLIRHGRPGQPASLEDYDAWLEGELQRLDAALPRCEKLGISVVVDLHSPPGGKATTSGYVGSDDRLFTDPKAQAHFLQVWRRMAQRYKSARPIWGYDLANEPVEEDVGEGCDDWHALAERTAKAIREIDPARAIIVEAPPWGSPESLAEFTPIAVSNVVYSAHMYVPAAFTHQGVFNAGAPPVSYPGLIDGKRWDKPALERALQPVIDFQKAYHVHIYIGEFSAIRWAPGESACAYLRDVIDIFEKYGWDWSYHAFREWQGWSVEHGSDRQNIQRAAEPTDRQQLLQSWFARNQKPGL